jgi:hypothetical protein
MILLKMWAVEDVVLIHTNACHVCAEEMIGPKMSVSDRLIRSPVESQLVRFDSELTRPGKLLYRNMSHVGFVRDLNQV